MEGVVEVVEVGWGTGRERLAWSIGRKELGLEDFGVSAHHHRDLSCRRPQGTVVGSCLSGLRKPLCVCVCVCGLRCTLEGILEVVVCLTKSMLSQSNPGCVNGRRLAAVEKGVCK